MKKPHMPLDDKRLFGHSAVESRAQLEAILVFKILIRDGCLDAVFGENGLCGSIRLEFGKRRVNFR